MSATGFYSGICDGCGKQSKFLREVNGAPLSGGSLCLDCDKPKPDLLNQLHTLRSLANDVKKQADEMHLWQISAIVATISEQATICIEKLNGRAMTRSTFNPKPVETEDFISNVRFQLDNVEGYQMMFRDGLQNDQALARIKAACLKDAADALLAHLQRKKI